MRGFLFMVADDKNYSKISALNFIYYTYDHLCVDLFYPSLHKNQHVMYFNDILL